MPSLTFSEKVMKTFRMSSAAVLINALRVDFQVILKPALGSFCTLDPLGYDYKQMDVMFMTLGSMIGQLRRENVGEHQLKLLFALLRTCAGMYR